MGNLCSPPKHRGIFQVGENIIQGHLSLEFCSLIFIFTNLILHLCVCMQICAHKSRSSLKPEVQDFPGTGVRVGWEPLNIGAGNLIRVLCRSGIALLTSEPALQPPELCMLSQGRFLKTLIYTGFFLNGCIFLLTKETLYFFWLAPLSDANCIIKSRYRHEFPKQDLCTWKQPAFLAFTNVMNTFGSAKIWPLSAF